MYKAPRILIDRSELSRVFYGPGRHTKWSDHIDSRVLSPASDSILLMTKNCTQHGHLFRKKYVAFGNAIPRK